MVLDLIVCMEVADHSLSGLELFAVCLLLLEHLLFILSPLVLQVLLSLLHHIINVLRLLVHCPPVVNFCRLKPILIVIHYNIDLTVLLYLHSHLFDLINYRTLKIVLKFIRLFDVLSGSLDLGLDFSELF